MAQPLHRFLPRILPSVPACPEPTAEAEVLAAAIELCQRTRCWRLIDDRVLPSGWSGPIAISLPDGAALHEIERAWFSGRKLDPEPFTDAPPEDLVSGPATAFSQVDRGEILLWPAGEAGTLRLSLFLKPSQGADEVPDDLFQDHLEDIAAGALGKLLLIPEKSWTNPSLAGVYVSRFEAACNKHFASNIRGQQGAPARTRARFL